MVVFLYVNNIAKLYLNHLRRREMAYNARNFEAADTRSNRFASEGFFPEQQVTFSGMI